MALFCLCLGLQSLSDDALHQLLQQWVGGSSGLSAQNASQRLLGVFGHHVHLNVYRIALLLLRKDDPLLGISNQHNLPPAFGIVHLSDRQACTINRNESLVHNIPQHLAPLWLEPEGQGVAILSHRQDLGCGVDVALDKVATHAGVGTDGALQVHLAGLHEVPEVGNAESLWGNANVELRLSEGRYSKAASINSNGVSLVAVLEKKGAGGNCKGHSGAAGRVICVELRDDF